MRAVTAAALPLTGLFLRRFVHSLRCGQGSIVRRVSNPSRRYTECIYIYMYICVVEDGAQKGRRNEFLRPDDTDVPISRVAVLESLRAEIKFIGRAAFRKRKADGGREDGSGKNKVSGCRERATEELEKCGSV